MEPHIIARADHPISRKDIDPDVLRVLYKLKDAGHESYLVGGAVRDLLMGRLPKDFDVATSARPNELRRIFRNSRIVGRRFRLVHVFFGSKNVEVATLRSSVVPSTDPNDLYIEEDNEWGDLESDSFRRDFTVNALYYDIRDFAVVDYTGGVKDLHDHVIRSIGDPQVRFREDPVRMLRAIKFAARFGYTFEAETEAALRQHQQDILKASRFRVTEEVFRILIQPNRHVGLKMLKDYGFLSVIYPQWLESIGAEGFEQVLGFFEAAEKEAANDRFFPMEVLATGLFVPLLDTVNVETDSFHRVASRVSAEIGSLARQMDLPKRLSSAAMDLLRGQLYLLFFYNRPKRVKRYVAYPGFDLVWRVHELAFGHIAELDPIRDVWAEAREGLRRPIGGTVQAPDRRDIFSFRGKTGGGRNERPRRFQANGEPHVEEKSEDEWIPFVDEEP
jgi:poly(A) polymerase